MSRSGSSYDRQMIRHQVREIFFDFMTEEEILAMSVKKITSPKSFDAFNFPLPGGLNDRALGPINARDICQTCGQTGKDCPGHLGHIELAMVVYHPLLFAILFSMLKSKCFNCHKFRLAESKCRIFAIKLALCDIGQAFLARSLDAELVSEEDPKGNLYEEDKMLIADRNDSNNFFSIREEILKKYEEKIRMAGKRIHCFSHDRAFRRQLREEIISKLKNTNKCANCGAFSPALRKDKKIKLFQKKLGSRLSHANMLVTSHMESALEASQKNNTKSKRDDSDSEEEQVPGDSDVENSTPDIGDAILNDGQASGDLYIHPMESEAQMRLLWEKQGLLLSLLFRTTLRKGVSGQCQSVLDWNPDGYKLFFMHNVVVPPTRFRPPMKLNDGFAEHPQNTQLIKVLQVCEDMRNINMTEESSTKRMLNLCVELQRSVNGFIDSSGETPPRGVKEVPAGIRQMLEKKEGLFRKHMMGKRVNHSCRSVISPDPYIGTTEIGIPLRFAKVLCFPQPVSTFNFEYLRQLVENGPNIYPGANFVERSNGTLINLGYLNSMKRKGIAATLLNTPGRVVWRHLKDKDAMLVNRQPTLHKPGIMAHHVRVLLNPSYQTIRMHYANCNTYNADFDGDEINCHLPQSELARAEANVLAFTNEQYLVNTNGKPLRGLIQDSVDAGVKLSSKNIFLSKEDFQQLIFQALAGFPGLEITAPHVLIQTPQPTILKPKQLWTGKQVFSCILKHLTTGLPQLNLNSKTKMPAIAFGEKWEEHEVVIREGELLKGVLDKAAFGASEGGLVHSVHEIYGPEAAGTLLTALGRVLVTYLQFSGHTCGVEDLTLNKKAESERRNLIKQSHSQGLTSIVTYLKSNGLSVKDIQLNDGVADKATLNKIREQIAVMLSGTDLASQSQMLDGYMMSELSQISSDIIKVCIPVGQEKPFPENGLSLMVLTGAKGSMVNHSQISCALGQQALEGRRVPIMSSGKSLPSFQAFDPNPRANGFITDRFLTGIRPQDYYFHCMAGREGLVDTAVKTSRSGYLQRCLVKHLEELTVAYDGTVRDGEGSILQFIYGDDGIDTSQTSFLDSENSKFDFMARNYNAISHKYMLNDSFLAKFGLSVEKALDAHLKVANSHSNSDEVTFKVDQIVEARCLKKGREDYCRENLRPGWTQARIIKIHSSSNHLRTKFTLKFLDGREAHKVPRFLAINSNLSSKGTPFISADRIEIIRRYQPEPVLSKLSGGVHFGAVSEKFQNCIENYVKSSAYKEVTQSFQNDALSPEFFTMMMWLKYMRSQVPAGESVGSIAAQSIGEPSTQMTLNTFHLAGHGGANVTLGVPRLREIIMAASKNLKTPAITIPLHRDVSEEQGKLLARRLTKLPLSELLRNSEGGISVTEKLLKGDQGLFERHYVIALKLFPVNLIGRGFNLSFKEVCRAISSTYLKKLIGLVVLSLRRCGEDSASKKANVKSSLEEPEKTSEFDEPHLNNVDESDSSDNENQNEGKRKTKDRSKMLETIKKSLKSDQEYEQNDSDNEEGQGTLRFGRKEEMATYGDMDDDEKEIFQANDSLDDIFDEPTKLDTLDDTNKDGDAYDEGGDLFNVAESVKKNLIFGGLDSDITTSTVTVTLKFPATVRRLLMVEIAQMAANASVVRCQGDIGRAFVVEQLINGENRTAIQLEGHDFHTIWGLDPMKGGSLLDINCLSSNHIYQILNHYGVEACRAAIPNEIASVFGVYGIAVDYRHLGLVADYMTYFGDYRPLSRHGMADCSSPCLQMSFETTADFLIKAAVDGTADKLRSPSSRIVVGQVGKFGTGCFDLVVPINMKA